MFERKVVCMVSPTKGRSVDRLARLSRLARLAPLAAILVCIQARPVSALSVERCVSTDNHVYTMITTTNSRTQVTSVALTSGSANACSEVPAAGQVLTSAATGQGVLLPNRMRTTVVSGLPTNSISCAANFNANGAGGQGILMLPNGSTVSADSGFSSPSPRGRRDRRCRRSGGPGRHWCPTFDSGLRHRPRDDNGLSFDRRCFHPV